MTTVSCKGGETRLGARVGANGWGKGRGDEVRGTGWCKWMGQREARQNMLLFWGVLHAPKILVVGQSNDYREEKKKEKRKTL